MLFERWAERLKTNTKEPEEEITFKSAEEITEEKAPTEAPAASYTPQNASIEGSNIELKVVRPASYEEVSTVADHLIAGCTVVLNLEGTNKETARRLIDFLSGVAYSIDGQLKRVANNTFVITPHNVDVSGDQLRGPEPKPEPKSPIDEDDLYTNEL